MKIVILCIFSRTCLQKQARVVLKGFTTGKDAAADLDKFQVDRPNILAVFHEDIDKYNQNYHRYGSCMRIATRIQDMLLLKTPKFAFINITKQKNMFILRIHLHCMLSTHMT
ncbi:hypothetical protein NERG_02298 [Nematocida ausubeli]|uniref:Uncharacterized protein n=1 Tax=Nematocida ausubeli (strain ATCC PRA-371 / ERTm2) TaxID=1913371 RepID=H8ZFC7_NEMA1|nr:hypothetical protein NERG_02298 [Nematocida ausubeli]